MLYVLKGLNDGYVVGGGISEVGYCYGRVVVVEGYWLVVGWVWLLLWVGGLVV